MYCGGKSICDVSRMYEKYGMHVIAQIYLLPGEIDGLDIEIDLIGAEAKAGLMLLFC